MIPDSFIEELKYASDIEKTISSYVSLKRKGRNLGGLCPFHSEKTPSFTVYLDTQSYYCFGCGNGGDVITFIRNIENLEYMDALKFLADKNGLTLPENTDDSTSKLRTKILEINRETARYFHQQLLNEQGETARAYLLGRGLSSKTVRKFGIGYAPEGWDNLKNYLTKKGFSQKELLEASVVTTGKNQSCYDVFRDRIMFPIIDLRGNVIAFGGRLMGQKGPKYLNTSDTLVFKKSRNLFSINFAKASSSDILILGEGYMDVVAMHQAGFENSVATLGTSLTSEQSRLIAQYAKKVVIAYDSDKAGQNATKRAINLFSATNISVSVLQLEGAKDPDEYIQKFGAEKFAHLLQDGKSAMNFEIDKLKQKYDFSLSNDKVLFLNDFCKLMSEVNNALQRDVYIGEITEELNISKESVASMVEGLRKKRFRAKEQTEERELATSISVNLGTDQKKHKKNIEGLIAEELLITLFLIHPDCYKSVKNEISAKDFVDEGYKSIYNVIVDRIENNLSLELINMSSSLTNELMAKLSHLTIKGQGIKFYPSQAEEYARAIKAQHNQKSKQQVAEMSEEEYKNYLSTLRAEKK